MGQGLAQALSLQSMSRPIARTAELVSGYSITQKGNTVQIPEEVMTPTGIFARVLGTRPIAEQKLRDADHLNHFYGAVDYENRQKAMNKLRTAIRNGSLNEEKTAKIAEEYMKLGGTPRGWQAAINTAVHKTDTSGKDNLISKLKPESPLNYMIDHLDGE